MRVTPRVLPDKDPEERIVIPFDYSDEMAGAESIVAAIVTAEVKTGVNANPVAALDGQPSLFPQEVFQAFTGLDDVVYLIRCRATLSSGRILVRAALLPVRRFD